MILSTVPVTKFCPLRLRPRILGKIDVALKLDHTRRGSVARLRVESHVPHTRRAILRVAVAGGVDEVLLGSCVRADQSNEVMCVNRLGREELEKGVGGVFLAGEKTGGSGFGVVFAADEGADARAERAYNSGNIGAELNDVSHGHAVLVVFVVPFHGLVGDGGKTVVVCAGHLVTKENTW